MKVWDWRIEVRKSSLKSTTKLVLFVMATYMDNDGKGCFPSQDRLARDASLTERAIRIHISHAVEAGFLKKKKRNLKGSQWAANEYEATIPIITLPKVWGELNSPHTETSKEPHTPKEGIQFRNEGNTVPTNSSSDSSINSPGWGLLMKRLRNKYGKAVFRSWFSNLSFESMDETSITLCAPTRFAAEWIKAHYLNNIQMIILDIWPNVKEVLICSIKVK